MERREGLAVLISASVKGVPKELYIYTQAKKFAIRNAAAEVAIEALLQIRKITPAHTGAMRNSYVVEELPEGFALYSTVPYFEFVNDGVPCPSLGRYVPAIGKRYTRAYAEQYPRRAGFHPGQKPQRLLSNTLEHVSRVSSGILNRWMRE